MGQQELIIVLEDSRHPLTLREISQLMQEDEVKICKTLKRMIKYDEVKCIELNRMLAAKFYNCKRKLRLYYI